MGEREWINKHSGIIIFITSLSLVVLIGTYLLTSRREEASEYDYRKPQRTAPRKVAKKSLSGKDTIPVVRGNLIFERIPLSVKESSGEVHVLRKKGNTVKCGDSLDVMWFPKQVLFMKEKGLFEEVLVAGDARFSDLEWDGQNIWVSVPERGIWVQDTSGVIVAKIGSESGLPPAERGLLLHLIEPGRMFAVGSFGPRGRGWCATVEFKNGEVSVDVFHEAKRVPAETDDEEEVGRDPFVVFRPYLIREYLAVSQSYDPNIVGFMSCRDRTFYPGGRRTLFVARCEKKSEHKHRLRYPLEINLDTLSVRISTRPMTSLGVRSILPSPNLEYNGKVYVPGRVWYRIDPNTRRREDLVTQGKLPDPYGSLRGYWVSAHYGLVGWTANQELFQIRITDEVHDIMAESPASKGEYFHTFAFEDENGSPTRLRNIDSVCFAVHRNDKPTLNYRYNPARLRGYFPSGTYRVWATRTNNMGHEIKVCECKPIEVTEESPVRLVFKVKPRKPKKVKPREEVLYCGQVINAVTGKPVEGASVRVGPDGARKRTITTDASGRFEVSVETSDPHYKFGALGKDYFCTAMYRRDLADPTNGRVEIQPILLFPAAKLKIAPCIGGNVAAKYRSIAGHARIRPWVVVDANEDPIWSSTFSSMYGWLTDRGSIPVPYLEMNQEHTFPVPAGVNFELLLISKYESLYPPDIPQTIKLKQGEVLDLGLCMFKPAVQVFLKVVNSAGKPLKGVAITKTFSDAYYFIQSNLNIQGRPHVHITDENGRTAFYVRPNSEEKFDVYRDVRHWDVLKTVAYKIGGEEDEGKEFVLQL